MIVVLRKYVIKTRLVRRYRYRRDKSHIIVIMEYYRGRNSIVRFPTLGRVAHH